MSKALWTRWMDLHPDQVHLEREEAGRWPRRIRSFGMWYVDRAHFVSNPIQLVTFESQVGHRTSASWRGWMDFHDSVNLLPMS